MPWKILWGELFISKPNSLFMPQADHSKTIHLQKFIPNVNVIRKSVFNRAHITRSLVTTNSRSVKKRVSDATFHRVKRERTQLTCRNLVRSEEHTSELQSRLHLVCRLLLEKKKHK